MDEETDLYRLNIGDEWAEREGSATSPTTGEEQQHQHGTWHHGLKIGRVREYPPQTSDSNGTLRNRYVNQSRKRNVVGHEEVCPPPVSSEDPTRRSKRPKRQKASARRRSFGDTVILHTKHVRTFLVSSSHQQTAPKPRWAHELAEPSVHS